MSNIIQNHLYLKGPIAPVDEVVSSILSAYQDAERDGPTAVTFALTDDVTTVECRFQSYADAPYEWLKKKVEEYHDAGVEFFLFWFDLDNINQNPDDFEVDLTFQRFGEYYTVLIPHEEGDNINHTTFFNSPELGVRTTDGPLTLVFNRRRFLGDDANEFLNETGIVVRDIRKPPNQDSVGCP